MQIEVMITTTRWSTVDIDIPSAIKGSAALDEYVTEVVYDAALKQGEWEENTLEANWEFIDSPTETKAA